jgi:phage gp29-like protein
MPGDTLYLVDSQGVHEIPGMPPGRGQSLFPHGAGFISLFGGGAARVYWPSDQALTRARQHAVLMRADAAVMECVELRQRAVALLDWRVECDKENDPQYTDAREKLTAICQRIPRFMQYRENLLHALWYGRYALAHRYRWDWLEGEKLVVVASWMPIHGDKLVWKIEADAGSILDGIGVRVGGGTGLSEEVKRWQDEHRAQIESTDYGWAYFPPPGMRELLIVHRHYIEDGEYEEPRNAARIYGVGLRDRIYWTWYQRQEALAWLMEFLERSAFGIELWYYPDGNPQGREEMKQAAAERVGPGKNILLIPRPPGVEGAAYGVERIEPSMAGAQILKEILTDFFGHQIKRYVLGQTLTTEAHATGLGSNLASIHLDTFLQIVRYDATNLQETLTEQLIRRLVAWNWPGLDPTAFRFVIEVEKEDVRERVEALRTAFDMGLKIKAAEVRDILKLSPVAEGEDFLQNPAYRESMQAAPPPGVEAFSETGERERYRRPPFPSNPSRGQTFVYEKKVYAYIPNKAGRLQWQVVGEDRPSLGQQVFVSPNRESGLNFAQAREKTKGSGQARIRTRAAEVCQAHGHPVRRMWDVIGDWDGGSENSLLIELERVPVVDLERIAAHLGKEFDQEAVAVFRSRRQGTDLRWTAGFRLPAEEVIPVLEKHGIGNRTIIERPGGCLVLVCGEAKDIRPSVNEVVKELGCVKEFSKGVRGDFRLVWRNEYDSIIGETGERREHMADLGEGRERGEQTPQEQVPWFMNDEIVNQLSTKYRNLALTQRKSYLAKRERSPEENERLFEEIKQEFLARGDEWEEPEDDEDEQIIL